MIKDDKTPAVKMLPYKFYYNVKTKILPHSFATTVFISDTKPKLFYGKPRNQKLYNKSQLYNKP